MSRIVSVWLRAWPIARLLAARACAAPADAARPKASPRLKSCRPLVLVAPGQGGARIVSLNRAAQQAGLAAGDLLSNARSKVLDLEVGDADPAADAAALSRLALWCLRYTPTVAPWDEAGGADGLFLDITGCAHLLGGEEALLTDLERRLRAFGLDPRLAVADTAGAAWAVAHCGAPTDRIVPPGGEREALRRLPLAALRLSTDSQALLRRLGLRRIGELADRPRAPFAARFSPEVLLRLDQALGRAPEPLVPVAPPPLYRAQAAFLEPILSAEHVLEAATRLLGRLARDLAEADAGARVLRLLLFRVDGGVQSLDIGLAAPSRDPAHIAQLLGLRLYRLGSGLEADFGFEAAAVHVLAAEPLAGRQDRLGLDGEGTPPEALACLIDRLQQRLGAGAVRRLQPRASHIPERAVRAAPPSPHAFLSRRSRRGGVAEREHAAWVDGAAASRPLLMLPRPEPAEVVALIPDGPPRQFRWRGVLHQVAQAEGPERIAPEWWRAMEEATRDYYVVEDDAGRRFWLYRAGLYGRDAAPPRWFVHGVLA